MQQQFSQQPHILQESELPYLIPQYQTVPVNNGAQLGNNYGTAAPAGTSGKMSRQEKKAMKKEQKAQKKQAKADGKASKPARGSNIGGGYIAPVCPREEMFMGHPVIMETQKPGMATGYGIPENVTQGSPSAGGFGNQGFSNQGFSNQLGSNYTTGSLPTTSTYSTGSTYTTGTTQYLSQPTTQTIVYESALPTTTTYGNQLGGTNYLREERIIQEVAPVQTVTVLQQQPMMQQQQQIQEPVRHAHPVQIQGYYDNMLLEQPHEKAGGFFAPFTGSLTNRGAGTTGGLQGQGKANFANTVASSVGGGYGGPSGAGYLGQGNNVGGNPLLNAPNLTYPVALENERMKGLLNNKHIGLEPQTQKLSRKEKKAMKNGANVNPEANNAAIY